VKRRPFGAANGTADKQPSLEFDDQFGSRVAARFQQFADPNDSKGRRICRAGNDRPSQTEDDHGRNGANRSHIRLLVQFGDSLFLPHIKEQTDTHVHELPGQAKRDGRTDTGADAAIQAKIGAAKRVPAPSVLAIFSC
jgi:hypothetical protein